MAAGQESVQSMIRNPDNVICQGQANHPHRFAIETLLPLAGREDAFVRVMHMDDPAMNGKTRGSEQVHGTH